MESNNTSKKTGFKVFLVFVVALIVALTLGMTAYYFLRDDEVIVIKNVELYVNQGDTFNVEIERRQPKSGTIIEFSIQDGNIVSMNQDKSFYAKQAGSTEIVLITNKKRIETQKCIVHIGGGTPDAPYYIDEGTELANIKEDSHYKLVSDINLKDSNFKPIGENFATGFNGTLDGNGHKIYNFTYSTETEMANAGLFTRIGANGVVKNIVLENFDISGNIQNLGAVAGINNGEINTTTISDAKLSSSYNGAYIGGVVGQNVAVEKSALIDRVATYAGLTSTNQAYIAGLTALNQNSNIINSYFNGNITSQKSSSVGAGLVYYNEGTGDNQSIIEKCYAVSNFALAENTVAFSNHGLIARDSYSAKTNVILGIYYDSTIASNASAGFTGDSNDSYFFKGKTTSQLSNVETYLFTKTGVKVWNFDFVWTLNETDNQVYPTLLMKAGEAVETMEEIIADNDIDTVDELKNMNMDETYRLISDLSLSSENWQPIGTKERPFNGVLDGNGHTIRNIKIDGAYTYAGLFGYLGPNAIITNLTIDGFTIQNGTYSYVGALAGFIASEKNINNITIKNVKVSGINSNSTIGGLAGSAGPKVLIENIKVDNISIKSGYIVGGVVGELVDAYIKNTEVTDSDKLGGINLSNTGSVYVGGIAGRASGTISEVTTTIDINVKADSVFVAGVVGYSTSDIVNAKSSSYITSGTSSDVRIGGIVGDSIKNITNSQFKGTILASTTSDKVYAGGIAGYNTTNANITKSGVKANITGFNAGGLVGYNNNATISQSYVLDGTNIKGAKAGGLLSSLERGKVDNCFTRAKLQGVDNDSIKAGMSVYVLGYTDVLGDGECAEMYNIFSASTFDTTGTNYAETYSSIRVSLVGSNNMKEAGYIYDSVYDKDLASGAKTQGGSGRWWWDQGGNSGYNHDKYYDNMDGRYSTSDCQKVETFTSRGFSSTVWNLTTGAYPTLSNINYSYFSN